MEQAVSSGGGEKWSGSILTESRQNQLVDRIRGIRERGTAKMTQRSWPEILKLGNFHQLRWEDQEFVGISF